MKMREVAERFRHMLKVKDIVTSTMMTTSKSLN